MKKRLQLWLSYLVILAPILYGVFNYDALPATMATHFGVNNQPDGYLAKPWAVFGIPVALLALQWISLSITRINARHKGLAPRFERVMMWIVPVITVVTCGSVISYNLGHQVDVWRIAVSLVGLIWILIGNYLPTVTPDQYYRVHRGPQPRPAIWRRLRYWYGYTLVGGGVLFLLSILTTPRISIGILGLAILALIGISSYGLTLRRRS